jgi:hypothetical protein
MLGAVRKAVEWRLGCPDFKEELLRQMQGKRGTHGRTELRESDEVHAEGLVQAELRRQRWTEGNLERRRKADPAKVEIAWKLRRQTTTTLKWIADRLKMGTWTYVSNCLCQSYDPFDDMTPLMTGGLVTRDEALLLQLVSP